MICSIFNPGQGSAFVVFVVVVVVVVPTWPSKSGLVCGLDRFRLPVVAGRRLLRNCWQMFVPEQREYLHRLSLSLVRSACSALRNHDLFKEIFKRAEKRSSPFLISSIPPSLPFSRPCFCYGLFTRVFFFLTSNFFSTIILEFYQK